MWMFLLYFLPALVTIVTINYYVFVAKTESISIIMYILMTLCALIPLFNLGISLMCAGYLLHLTPWFNRITTLLSKPINR